MTDLLRWCRSVLVTTPVRWLELSRSLPDGLLELPAREGEWSAAACLQHLVDTERDVFPVRVQAILDGNESFPAFNPDQEGTISGARTAQELAVEFARLREAALKIFDQVTPADLSKGARHRELGAVTLSELLHEWAGHDLMHTVQAERALMQPFIRGCGPWQIYFQDHIAQ